MMLQTEEDEMNFSLRNREIEDSSSEMKGHEVFMVKEISFLGECAKKEVADY